MLWATVWGALLRIGAAFCTTYSPDDGSQFAFPPRRCLTPDFMKEQFEKGIFGKEPINLSSGVQNIEYNGISMPLVLEASLGWESGHTVSAIADIILREILGVNTTFACTWGSVHAMKMIGGCRNPMDPTTSCASSGLPQLHTPLAHVSIESWVTTPAEVDEMNKYNTNLGMIGYYSKSGLYMDKEVAVRAYRERNITLEWWQSFVNISNVGDYFANYRTIADDINKMWPDGSVAPRCLENSNAFRELSRHGFHCTDGWFFGPACAAQKDSCVPVVLAEYDWNGLVWIQAIVQHGYRFAVTWLGSQNWLSYSMRTKKSLLFYCATTSAMCYEKPIVKMFADTKIPVGRPDLITSLLKVVWKQLPNIDSRVVDFVSQMNLPSDDLQTLMNSYSAKQAWTDVDTLVPEIACDWLTNKLRVENVAGIVTEDNTAKWERWIPRVCQTGHAYDKAMAVCRPCKAGKYSLNGRACVSCSPGTYGSGVAMSTCNHCEEGTWQSATGATFCNVCPAGSQRRAGDVGCQLCAAGHFAWRAGQPECKRCERGGWMDKAGATQCNYCSSSHTTTNEASTSDQTCVIDVIIVFQISVAVCLLFGAALGLVLGFRWLRHRRQLKEAREREQMYFKGAVAVMRTMCSSGVTLTISPEGHIKQADPEEGLEGLKAGARVQDCIVDEGDRARLDRQLHDTMVEFLSGNASAFASPFNFCIESLEDGDPTQLKSYVVAFKKDEILMGIQKKKSETDEHFDPPPKMPPCNLTTRCTSGIISPDSTATTVQSGRDDFVAVFPSGNSGKQYYPCLLDELDRESIPMTLPGSLPRDLDDEISFCVSATTFPESLAHSRCSFVKNKPSIEKADAQTQTDFVLQPFKRAPPLPGTQRGSSPSSNDSSRSPRGRSVLTRKSEAKKRGRSRSGTRSASRSKDARDDRGLQKTPKHTVCFMMCELAQAVHVPRSSAAACCHLHAVTDAIQAVIRDSLPCKPDWQPHSGWQCKECLALNGRDSAVCDVCSLAVDKLEPSGEYHGSGAGSSSQRAL